MDVCFLAFVVCFVCRSLCDELISRAEEPYSVCVCVRAPQQ
jgi:hypothetical protein